MKKDKASAIILLMVLSTLSIAYSTAAFAKDPVAEVTRELVCACGCGKVTYDCYCDLAKEWKEQITLDVSEGKTKQQIIASYVETYGDSVLATPKKSGLETTIWALPIVAAVMGTGVIYTYAKNKSPIPDSEVDSRVLESDGSRNKGKKRQGSKSTEHYDKLLRKELNKQKKRKR